MNGLRRFRDCFIELAEAPKNEGLLPISLGHRFIPFARLFDVGQGVSVVPFLFPRVGTDEIGGVILRIDFDQLLGVFQRARFLFPVGPDAVSRSVGAPGFRFEPDRG